MKITSQNLKKFLESLTRKERVNFRNTYIAQSGIAHATWYNYCSFRTCEMNILASEKMKQLAEELHPEKVSLLLKKEGCSINSI